jgi:hypothetical protein
MITSDQRGLAHIRPPGLDRYLLAQMLADLPAFVLASKTSSYEHLRGARGYRRMSLKLVAELAHDPFKECSQAFR